MKATHQPNTTPVSDPMQPAALLRGAALYIGTHGWLQGEFFANSSADNPFPAACSLGAINVCAHGRPVLSSDETTEDTLTDSAIKAMRVFAAYLDPDYGIDESTLFKASAIDIVSAWNDHDSRTMAEVIDALNDAANDWESIHHTGGAR